MYTYIYIYTYTYLYMYKRPSNSIRPAAASPPGALAHSPGVEGSGLRAKGLGFRTSSSRFRVGSGLRAEGLGF